MLGRQSLDEVFKSMCSSRSFIEKLELTIGKKPDYAALRKLQEDPEFNELSDHVFSMLTPLADSEETALCCILRMRESELRVLQQLHSKLQSEDASKLILEVDINSRKKIVEILKYALKLNQQENIHGIPLTDEDHADELDADAANMCQRIVQRRLNYLELIADGSIDGTQQRQSPFTPKLLSINQRLANTAKNVERCLSSLGGNNELSMHDLECSPGLAPMPRLGDSTSENGTPDSFGDGHEILTASQLGLHPAEFDRFDLYGTDSEASLSQAKSPSLAEAPVSSLSVIQHSTLSHKFEVMTAIPKKFKPMHPLSTANVSATFSEAVSSHSDRRSKNNLLSRHDSNHSFQSRVKMIAPFAMVKQLIHSKDCCVPQPSKCMISVSSQTLNVDHSALAAVPTEHAPICDTVSLRNPDLQHSPRSPRALDLEFYSQSKSTVLKIRKSSIGDFSQSKGVDGHSPVTCVYADLVHSSNYSPSGKSGASPAALLVKRPQILDTEAIRSPRKYEAQINRIRSASVGRVSASDAPLFRESYFPVMKEGSHLEFRSPNERFVSANSDSPKPTGWV
jgi:hypothetical protein